ncbi:MAG TPA: hypothetical protein VFR07_01845 [Mycobacteriales bacterium]|jgi:hypothetical protein|nr:hypothetical protein [Mycobacteriales bacterium]
MKISLHRPLNDPPPSRLLSGAERLAVEAALDEERLAHRGDVWRALRRHLPHPRPHT